MEAVRVIACSFWLSAAEEHLRLKARTGKDNLGKKAIVWKTSSVLTRYRGYELGYSAGVEQAFVQWYIGARAANNEAVCALQTAAIIKTRDAAGIDIDYHSSWQAVKHMWHWNVMADMDFRIGV